VLNHHCQPQFKRDAEITSMTSLGGSKRREWLTLNGAEWVEQGYIPPSHLFVFSLLWLTSRSTSNTAQTNKSTPHNVTFARNPLRHPAKPHVCPILPFPCRPSLSADPVTPSTLVSLSACPSVWEWPAVSSRHQGQERGLKSGTRCVVCAVQDRIEE
jgi:hypothetical protein